MTAVSFFCCWVNTLNHRNIKWRRHIVNNCVKKLLYTSVTISCTAKYRSDCKAYCSSTKTFFKFFNCKLFTFKIFHHKFFIVFSNSFNKFRTIHFSFVKHISRNINYINVHTLIIIIDVSLHFKKIDKTLEIVFSTDRQLNRNSITF